MSMSDRRMRKMTHTNTNYNTDKFAKEQFSVAYIITEQFAYTFIMSTASKYEEPIRMREMYNTVFNMRETYDMVPDVREMTVAKNGSKHTRLRNSC